MANQKPTNNKKIALTGTAGAVIVIILLVLSQLTGIDFLSLLSGTNTPAPTATFTPAAVAAVPADAEWAIYFTEPTGGEVVSGGVDEALVALIDDTESTLDIAAFEWNLDSLTDAVLRAEERGVNVRMVVDDEHTLEDDDATIEAILDAEIPVVNDDRGPFMHYKYMIFDGDAVWSGSWNFTINGTFANNNNGIFIRHPGVAAAFTADFEQMFIEKRFTMKKDPGLETHTFSFTDGTEVEVYFSPQDKEMMEQRIIDEIMGADEAVRVMSFVVTLDNIGYALLDRHGEGVIVQGLFDQLGAQGTYSEMPPLFCAEVAVREDGNPRIMHHKVIIIDDDTVITGSFNFSSNALNDNNENLLIIRSPEVTARYLSEFAQRWQEGTSPEGIACD